MGEPIRPQSGEQKNPPQPPPGKGGKGETAIPADTVVKKPAAAVTVGYTGVRPGVGFFRRFFLLRKEGAAWEVVVFGSLCLLLVLGVWWFVTRGEPEARIFSPGVLPSPGETFGSFPSLWFDRALTRNTLASLRRVTLGFGLAVAVGVPLGVLAGCFSWFSAFLAPVSIFGRNIPIAALIPLTFSLFGVGEEQKIMFIFVATVAFIISDSARAVMDVDRRYMDTAYTLGAKRRQVILKVLVPLALPDVFNSLRLLFGLAFGYIMLAELVKFGGESGGLGDIINMSQRRGPKEHILLVLMIIPVVALLIDRFPYRYGGAGILNGAVRGVLHGWEGFKGLFVKPGGFPVVVPKEGESGGGK